MSRARAVGRRFKRLTELGFPRGFPIVQFPNAPLILGVASGACADLLHGSAHRYLESVSYLGLAIWAYGELTDGANWLRRLLGVGFTVVLVIRVARAVHG